jgi:hypothetical protein
MAEALSGGVLAHQGFEAGRYRMWLATRGVGGADGAEGSVPRLVSRRRPSVSRSDPHLHGGHA